MELTFEEIWTEAAIHGKLFEEMLGRDPNILYHLFEELFRRDTDLFEEFLRNVCLIWQPISKSPRMLVP